MYSKSLATQAGRKKHQKTLHVFGVFLAFALSRPGRPVRE
jgi:hypothetical protein